VHVAPTPPADRNPAVQMTHALVDPWMPKPGLQATEPSHDAMIDDATVCRMYRVLVASGMPMAMQTERVVAYADGVMVNDGVKTCAAAAAVHGALQLPV
jgi:hypothetical protein